MPDEPVEAPPFLARSDGLTRALALPGENPTPGRSNGQPAVGVSEGEVLVSVRLVGRDEAEVPGERRVAQLDGAVLAKEGHSPPVRRGDRLHIRHRGLGRHREGLRARGIPQADGAPAVTGRQDLAIG